MEKLKEVDKVFNLKAIRDGIESLKQFIFAMVGEARFCKLGKVANNLSIKQLFEKKKVIQQTKKIT